PPGSCFREKQLSELIEVRSERTCRHSGHAPLKTESDPNVWSGRAVQEVSSILVAAVLHQCIRPLIGAFAPSHHGYQRACDLISGPASNGPLGSPVFACAGKTDPTLHIDSITELATISSVIPIHSPGLMPGQDT